MGWTTPPPIPSFPDVKHSKISLEMSLNTNYLYQNWITLPSMYFTIEIGCQITCILDKAAQQAINSSQCTFWFMV